ncbi:glycosyltransferase [Flavobacterium sp. Arc3]|uniref:glycosyltransferase n=1 Tax=Flavobacterium sp. Arc3 TaxID=3046686 RepID=UPI00352F941F
MNIINPMVSVIIPCYNHGRYLAQSIQSVYSQTYPFVEVIVVDDGSVDDTKAVCFEYPKVKYVYQSNSGLSAARNTGIKQAIGEYLVFLDADDWLFENGIKLNLDFLLLDQKIAFVSGAHLVFYEDNNHTQIVREEINENHYCRLLEGNYIGMHATVMYQRWVFDEFMFDTSLPYCEDYDLYLKITRKHPVFHHTGLVAVYRMHGNNMSANYSNMLKHVLMVLSNNEKHLKTCEEKESKKRGIAIWRNYYSFKIFDHLQYQLHSKKSKFNEIEVKTLKLNAPKLYLNFKIKKTKYLMSKIINKTKNIAKKVLPGKLFRSFQKISNFASGNSFFKKIDLGDLDRTTPFSTQFGYDRGGPLDRYYIENFLDENSFKVKGRALEIGDNEYTLKYGGDKLAQSDILHIDESNKQATYIGDLSNAPHLPSESFDCIILTQTLHLIYDYKAAIETCYRVLKPGGTLLLTVPGISHIAQDQWSKYWLWSFTDASMQRIMQEHFSEENITIKTYGNVLVASAFLYGMGLPELKKEQIDHHDPHYQVIITVKAIK